MDACEYEAIDARRTRVTEVTYVEEPSYLVKLEDSGRAGERRVMMVGIRDLILIGRIGEKLNPLSGRSNIILTMSTNFTITCMVGTARWANSNRSQ